MIFRTMKIPATFSPENGQLHCNDRMCTLIIMLMYVYDVHFIVEWPINEAFVLKCDLVINKNNYNLNCGNQTCHNTNAYECVLRMLTMWMRI